MYLIYIDKSIHARIENINLFHMNDKISPGDLLTYFRSSAFHFTAIQIQSLAKKENIFKA